MEKIKKIKSKNYLNLYQIVNKKSQKLISNFIFILNKRLIS